MNFFFLKTQRRGRAQEAVKRLRDGAGGLAGATTGLTDNPIPLWPQWILGAQSHLLSTGPGSITKSRYIVQEPQEGQTLRMKNLALGLEGRPSPEQLCCLHLPSSLEDTW